MPMSITNSTFLHDPQTYLEMGGRKAVYGLKQGLNFVVSLTSAPGTLVKVARKITECVGPALAHYGNCMATFVKVTLPVTGTIILSDFCESLNDLHYFFNGDYLKDRAKGRVYSIMAHIALVPADAIGILLHVKEVFNLSFQAAGNFAAAVGNLRVFGFVPKLAQAIQSWPLIRSIPDLAGKAAWIGDVRIFGLITKISLLTLVRTLVAAAHAYFAVSSHYAQVKCEKKAAEYAEKLKQRNITVNPDTKNLTEIFKNAVITDQLKKEEIGKEFVKYKNNLMKAKQAQLDKYSSVSEVAIKVAVISGLAAGATVAGSIAIGTLGAISLLCVGRSVYNRFTTSKLELQKVL